MSQMDELRWAGTAPFFPPPPQVRAGRPGAAGAAISLAADDLPHVSLPCYSNHPSAPPMGVELVGRDPLRGRRSGADRLRGVKQELRQARPRHYIGGFRYCRRETAQGATPAFAQPQGLRRPPAQLRAPGAPSVSGSWPTGQSRRQRRQSVPARPGANRSRGSPGSRQCRQVLLQAGGQAAREGRRFRGFAGRRQQGARKGSYRSPVPGPTITFHAPRAVALASPPRRVRGPLLIGQAKRPASLPVESKPMAQQQSNWDVTASFVACSRSSDRRRSARARSVSVFSQPPLPG